jgi:hypothetical protein
VKMIRSCTPAGSNVGKHLGSLISFACHSSPTPLAESLDKISYVQLKHLPCHARLRWSMQVLLNLMIALYVDGGCEYSRPMISIVFSFLFG